MEHVYDMAATRSCDFRGRRFHRSDPLQKGSAVQFPRSGLLAKAQFSG